MRHHLLCRSHPSLLPHSLLEGSFGVSRFGDLIYPLLAPSVGGLLWDNYFDFPVGGIDDNAAWTSFMWNRLAEWLVYGPPPPDPPPNARRLSSKARQRTLEAKKQWVSAARQILADKQITSTEALFQIYDTSSTDRTHSSGSFVGLRRGFEDGRLSEAERVIAEKVEGSLLSQLAQSLIDHYLVHLFPDLLTTHSLSTVQEVRVKITQRAQEIAHSRYFPSEKEQKKEETAIPIRPLATGATTRQYYASSLSASTTGEGLMVGSPGSGRVGGPQEGMAQLLLDLTKSNPTSKSTVTFYGGRGSGDTAAFPSYERFGWASASCDVNDDSIEDWIICAPSYAGGRDTEAAHGNYTGRCDIFFGPFNTDLSDPSGLGPVPDASLYGDRLWGNFGFTVVTGDVDGDGRSDIVISAPYAGRYSPSTCPPLTPHLSQLSRGCSERSW
jgi:hypothetical protein